MRTQDGPASSVLGGPFSHNVFLLVVMDRRNEPWLRLLRWSIERPLIKRRKGFCRALAVHEIDADVWGSVTQRFCRRCHAFKKRVACSTKSSGYMWCAP